MKFTLIESLSDNIKLVDKKDLFGLQLFFISHDDSIKRLVPRVPKSYAAHGLEDTTVKRVCFAPSIDQCMLAIGVGYSNLDRDSYTVYAPAKPLANYRWHKCEPSDVMDSYFTDEYWCLDTIPVTPLYKIKLENDKNPMVTNANGVYTKYNYRVLKNSIQDGPTYSVIEDFACSYELEYKEVAYAGDLETIISFNDSKELNAFYNCAKRHLCNVQMHKDMTTLTIHYISLGTIFKICDAEE